MTVTYHAGRRIQGLDADRTATQLPSGSVGGWVELGRTTLGATSDNIDVTGLADKRYLMFLFDAHGGGADCEPDLRLNSDTGTNYSYRYNGNGGTDSTTTSTSYIRLGAGAISNNHSFQMGYIANRSANEKLILSHLVFNPTNGAANVPQRVETVGKHAQTSNPVSAVNGYNLQAAGSFQSGDEIVVLGWDPADSHTTNFWQELASVDLSGGAADTISTGTITAKKYLWVQGYFENSGGAINQEITFNNDTSNNYAARLNIDGGTDSTSTSRANGYIGVGGVASPNFLNFFIINNASNEKLVMGHDVTQNTAGASTAPRRAEGVFKWVNTSNQITKIDFNNSAAGSYGTKTIIKVWGAD